jgi:hypothetical protein
MAKQAVHTVVQTADVIAFGSRARWDGRDGSGRGFPGPRVALSARAIFDQDYVHGPG